MAHSMRAAVPPREPPENCAPSCSERLTTRVGMAAPTAPSADKDGATDHPVSPEFPGSSTESPLSQKAPRSWSRGRLRGKSATLPAQDRQSRGWEMETRPHTNSCAGVSAAGLFVVAPNRSRPDAPRRGGRVSWRPAPPRSTGEALAPQQPEAWNRRPVTEGSQAAELVHVV